MTSSETTTITWAQLALVSAVAASHMSMPNHWLPYSLVGRAHSWTLRKTLFLTAMGAIGHATVTMIVVLAIFGMSNTIISHETYNILTVIVLLSFASYYLITYFLGRRQSLSCCKKDDDIDISKAISIPIVTSNTDKTKTITPKHHNDEHNNVSRAAALSVVSLTTFSPCVGSMPVLANSLAPPVSILTVVALWFTLTATAVAVMLPLVVASFVGVQYAFFTRVRKHERLLLGVMLILLALITLSLDDHHDHHAHHHHDETMEHVSCSSGSHAGCSGHLNHHSHQDQDQDQVADIVKGGMNVVLNGVRSKFGSSSDDHEVNN